MAMTGEITFHGKENIFALYFYAVCARACVLVCVCERARVGGLRWSVYIAGDWKVSLA